MERNLVIFYLVSLKKIKSTRYKTRLVEWGGEKEKGTYEVIVGGAFVL